MSLNMMNADQRQMRPIADRFCLCHAYQQCAHQAGTVSNRHRSYIIQRQPRIGKRLADHLAEEAAKEERIQKMDMGTAYVIFQNIDALDISDEEKAAAIFKVVNMETHNSVTKASMLKVLRWLLEFSFEIKEG